MKLKYPMDTEKGNIGESDSVLTSARTASVYPICFEASNGIRVLMLCLGWRPK